MLLGLLDSCIRSKSLIEGKIIHQHLLKQPFNADNKRTLLHKLTQLYAICNEVIFARRVFDQIPQPKPISWDLMIRSYAKNGHQEEALDLFLRMLKSGVEATKYTYPSVLKACSGLRAFEEGKLVHEHVKGSCFSRDVYVCTALVDFYAKCGFLGLAVEVFDEMPQRDIVAWNAMVYGFSLHGDYDNAFSLFVDMQRRDGFRPNCSSVAGLLPVLGIVGALRDGKAVHGYYARMCFDDDVVVMTGILDIYAKCGCISYARKVFDAISSKNEVTWTAMIGGYVGSDMVSEAGDLFRRILAGEDVRILTPAAVGLILCGCARFGDLNGGRCLHSYAIKTGFVLDSTVANSLVSFYAKCGLLDDAVRCFEEMGLKDTVSFNAIISGCVENSEAEEAFRFLRVMKSSKVGPDSATMLGILPACSHLAAVEQGYCCHGYCIVRGFVVDTLVCNALVDMYSKCGKVHVARQVFDRMHNRDIVSWNSMMFGYGIHGLGKEALWLFNDMQVTGLKPDDVTFLCLLSTCSHAGLVEEGKRLFSLMIQDFNIVPRMDHFICMTDLLGRAGHLDEAHDFIKKMPFEPDSHVWGALLAACRTFKNVQLGDEVSKKIRSLGPEGTGNFILLSNVYSAAERWDDAADIRIQQKNKGFDKSPGCSWIEVNGLIRAFVGGAQCHLQ